MITRNIFKVAFAITMIFAISTTANAQLGNLKNKVKNAVKKEVQNATDKATKNATDKATSTVTEKAAETSVGSAVSGAESTQTPSGQTATGPKVKANGPKPAEVTVKSNIDDIYKAFFYYLELNEQAIEQNDLSYLCSVDADKPFNILYKVIINHPQRKEVRPNGCSEALAQAKYGPIAEKRVKLIGEPPTPTATDPYQRYMENMNWYMDKINGTEDLNIQGYHLANALAMTKFAIMSKDNYMTKERLASPEYQAIAARLNQVWNDMCPEFKEQNKGLEGATSVEGVEAANKVQEAIWAKEAKDAKEADLEHIKNSLEDMPASKWDNPQLEAQCLAVIKKKNPKIDFVKAVLMSPEWQYDYQWGNPIRRRVHCWCVFKMTNGYYKAVQVSFKQMNTGGGNYSELDVNGVYNTSFKYVKYN